MRRAPLLTLCLVLLVGCQPDRRTTTRNFNAAPSPRATADPFPPESVTAYVVRSDAPLRDEPGEKGIVLRYLDSGESLTVLYPDRAGPWYEVQSDLTRQHGWIHASVIRLKAPPADAVTPTPSPARTPLPTATPTPRRTPTPEPEEEEEEADTGVNGVKVWVNTTSGVYHCPGTRWYGQTKQGEYMTQKQAVDEGHRPAYGRICGSRY